MTVSWVTAAVSAAEVRPMSANLPARDAFVSPGRFLVDRILKTGPMELLMARPLNLPRRARISRSHGPLRQIQLVGGDRISAEILRWGETDIELRLTGGQAVSVPRACIETVLVPSGEIELLAERFEEAASSSALVDESVWRRMAFDSEQAASGQRSLRLSSATPPLSMRWPQPLEGARVQFWFCTDRSEGPPAAGRITFEFEKPAQEESLVLEVASTQMAVATHPRLAATASRQTVPLRRGWHCLTAIISPSRTFCLVDDLLVASQSGSSGRLRAIQFAARSPFWIDDLLVSRLDERTPSLVERFPADDDLVATPDGEELFGRVKALSPAGIVLDSLAGERTLSWPEVAAVKFLPPSRSVQGSTSPREGLVARIECQSLVDRPALPSDRLAVTITHADRDTLTVWHPFLGEFLLAWHDISRLEPQFVGRPVCLDARRIHLGDSLRADFRRPLPDGSEWSAEFDVATKPSGEVWLSLNAADLEPSGPETPPASPFLNELRAGRLLTEVFVNDQPVGDLNRWIRFRSTPDRPERVRCRLPIDVLRAGRNSLRLRQRPLTDEGADFDDCELSNLRVEFSLTRP